MDHGLGCGNVGRDGDVKPVADLGNGEDVGFVRAVHDRVVEEDDQIQIAPLDHIDKLLFSAYAAGKKLVNLQIGHILDMTSGHFRSVELMFGQDVFVGQTKIFDQAFFAVVGDEADIHM